MGIGYKWVKMDIALMPEIKNIIITPEILKLIAETSRRSSAIEVHGSQEFLPSIYVPDGV